MNQAKPASLVSEVEAIYGPYLKRRGFHRTVSILRRILNPFQESLIYRSNEFRMYFVRERGESWTLVGPNGDRREHQTRYVLAYINGRSPVSINGEQVQWFGSNEAAALDALHDQVAIFLRAPSSQEWDRLRQYTWSEIPITPLVRPDERA